MTAKELVQTWDGLSAQEISDLPLNQEVVNDVETIIEHYRVCQNCRADFDAMEYEDKLFWQFADRVRLSAVEEWVCGSENKVVHEVIDCSEL